MSASSKKHRRMVEDEIYELKDIQSNEENSSLIDSPRHQKNLDLKKLRPKNRISSPQFSPESNNESSITLSPMTKNAFFAKDPQSRNTTPKSTSANSSSVCSDQSEQSRHIPIINGQYEKNSSNLSNIEAQSNTSDKSNIKLYREQIRNRFLSKKQQAGFTAIQAKKHERKRKHKTKKIKNEIELETEDSYLNIELSNHSKKRQLLHKNKSKENDLFDCRISISEEPKNEQSNENKIEDIESNRQEQTIIELLHLDEKEIVSFVKPVMCKEIYNPKTLCEIDTDIKNVPKIDDNVELRNFEDEGLYVGEKPPISKKMLTILEKRLLATGNRKWFGCDGQLKFLSDPRRTVLLKPSTDKPINSELLTVFKLPIKYEPGLLTLTETNEKHLLKIYISKIKFKHHPLFSPEHFLACRLENLYDQYSKNTNKMNYIKLHNKLQALRQAQQKILHALEVDSENVTEKQKNRLQNYCKEIKKIRELRLQEYKKYRDLIKSILKIWKYLKQVREKQNFTNTSIRLVIKKEKCSYEDEKVEWNSLIEIETNEIYEERKLQYKEELQEYRKQLREWKSHKFDDEEKPEKPIKNFSIESISKEVCEKFTESLKPPGEPRLHFELHFDKEITKIVNFPREKARRNSVNKTKLHLKVYFDDLQVYKTNSVILNDSFVCDINQSISIECSTIPKNIFIEIQEEYRGSNNKCSFQKISLPPPNSDITFENNDTQRHEFNHTQTIIYTHTGIGMGHNLQNIFESYSLENIDSIDDIYLSGLLYLKYGWDSEHSIPLSINKNDSLVEMNQFDPQDPQNKDYVNYIQKSKENVDIKNYFRLNYGEDIFCTDDDIENNPRYRMLSLRAKGEYEFQNEVVPNRENEIDLNIFGNYEKRKREEMETFTIDDYTYENQIDTQRQWGIRQYQQILKRAIDLCKTADKTYSLKNILVNDEVPDLSSILFSFMKWFQPKRPLRPSRKSSNQNALPTVSINNVYDLKIVINIVQAFQVPIRRAAALQEMTMSPGKRSSSDLFSLIPVRPLVIATFGKQQISTTTAEGSNPTWNQELILSIQYKQNETLNESICLNIFDEQLVDLLEDDRYRQIDIHQRRQLHWLASLQIPLQTVTETNRIEGTFEMNSPSFMIGYEKVFQNKDDTVTLTPKSIFESRDSIYLNLFVTLLPPISGMQTLKDDNLECNEVPLVENHIRTWQQDYRLQFPSRNFPVLIKDSNCKTCCITRFLKALNHPNFKKDITHAPVENFCMRLVSLIPFNTNTHFDGIWLTSDQFLKLQIGSISDHAVLLQCYLMHLNIESWLAFGYCMLQGNTTFVVYKQITDCNEKIFYAVNIVTGCKYDVRHSFNPFKRLYCLINHENVWANIQKEDQMNLIRYDVTKSSDWLPLFTKQVTCPMSSFQPNTLEYLPLSDIKQLEDRIEIKLKSKIMKWRQHTRTSWNRHASFLMKQLLPLLENHQILGSSEAIDFNNNQNLMLDIQTLMNTHKTYGFPLNMPYTTIRSICEAVYKTNIHNNDTPNIEFALAVHLQQYTGGILVVWIYICTLIRRR